jgi:small-conductance mechanosensitive channel
LALDNLGVNVTALVAGLGVGGVAVALAVQNILGDLFASLSIVLDKPFVLGDFIIVGELLGAVENIGIKTTRVRSLSGEQLIFSNNDLLNSRIRNFGRMAERRVVFQLGVVYGTPKAKLEQIPAIIRSAIEAQQQTRFDRSHFAGYGDFSLDFENVYYVLDRDYNVYMDIQQAINLEIYGRFAEDGIEFAYPTQTLYLQREQRAESLSAPQNGAARGAAPELKPTP